MPNEDRSPRIELVQNQDPKLPPKRANIFHVRNASLDLYDVALRAREISALLLAIPETPEISSELRTKIQVFDLVSTQAIEKAEGAL